MSDTNPAVRIVVRIVLIVLVAVGYQSYKSGSLGKAFSPKTTTQAGGGEIAGVSFPALKAPLRFIGGGTRTKYGIAQIYAAALYVNPKVLQKNRASNDNNMLAAVIADASSTKTITLHFLRDVDAQKVQESLQQELSKRLSKPRMEAFVDKLHQVLPPDRVTKGSEITMTCSNGNKKLTFASAGKTAVLANDKEACPALWDVYIGKEAVSKDIRDGFQKGATAVLAEES